MWISIENVNSCNIFVRFVSSCSQIAKVKKKNGIVNWKLHVIQIIVYIRTKLNGARSIHWSWWKVVGCVCIYKDLSERNESARNFIAWRLSTLILILFLSWRGQSARPIYTYIWACVRNSTRHEDAQQETVLYREKKRERKRWV